MKRIPTSALLGLIACLLTGPRAFAAKADPEKDAFVREDWIASYEPNRPDYWGNDWAYNNFFLPFRGLVAGKHQLETRYFGNYRFDSDNGGLKGMLLRVVVGTGLDFDLYQIPQNVHHVNGHDAAAREADRSFGRGISGVPKRFAQMLPAYFGGKELAPSERSCLRCGADVNSQVEIGGLNAENYFAYDAGKDVLGDDRVNSKAVEFFMFNRVRFLETYTDEVGTLDQTVANNRTLGAHGTTATDVTSYLYNVNIDRYGVAKIGDFRLTTEDVKKSYYIQFADPLMLSALYAWGRDYVGRGSNTTTLPMIPLGEGWHYLPGWRVYYSPFGIEYYLDNYIRSRGILANLFWTRGDNHYEKRNGGGVDVQNIPLPRHGKLGVFATVEQQPLLSHLVNNAPVEVPISAAEFGRTHVAYNVGGSIELPVWTFDKTGDDPRRLFLYARGGTKNLSWFPGEYFGNGLFLQTGLGARL